MGLDDEIRGVPGHFLAGPAGHHLLEAAAGLVELVVDVEDLAGLVGDGRCLGVVRDLLQEGVRLAHQAGQGRWQRVGPGHLGRRALGRAQHLALGELSRGAEPRHLALPGDDRRQPGLGEVLVVGRVVPHVGVRLRRPREIQGVVEAVGAVVGELVGVPGVGEPGQVVAVGLGRHAVGRRGQLEPPLLLVALGLRVMEGGGAHQALLPEVAHLLHHVGIPLVAAPPLAALPVGGHEPLARRLLLAEAAVALPGGDDLRLDLGCLGSERRALEDQLVGLHRLGVPGLVEEDVAEPLVDLGLVGPATHRLEEGPRTGHAAPPLVGEADGGVLHRLGPHLARGGLAGLLRPLHVVVEQLDERRHRAAEVVHAVVGPAQLVDGAGVEGVARIGLDLREGLGRPLQRVGLHLVEVPVAQPHPGLRDERAVRVALDEGVVGAPRLLLLPHLAEAVGQQVVDAVEEAVLGEAGDEPLVERDGAGVALQRLRGSVPPLGHGALHLLAPLGELLAVLVVGLLVVQLGQAEHGVRSEAGIVRIAAEKLLELRDGVLALLALEDLEVADGLLVVVGQEAAPLVVLLLHQDLDLLPVLARHLLEAVRPLRHLPQVAVPHRGLGPRCAAPGLGDAGGLGLAAVEARGVAARHRRRLAGRRRSRSGRARRGRRPPCRGGRGRRPPGAGLGLAGAPRPARRLGCGPGSGATGLLRLGGPALGGGGRAGAGGRRFRRRRRDGASPQDRPCGERGGRAEPHGYCTSRSTSWYSWSMVARSALFWVDSCWIFSTRSRLRCQATSTMPTSALSTSW